MDAGDKTARMTALAGALLTLGRLGAWLVRHEDEEAEYWQAMTNDLVDEVIRQVEKLRRAPAVRTGWDWPDRVGQLCALMVVQTLLRERDVEEALTVLAAAEMEGLSAPTLIGVMLARCGGRREAVEAGAVRLLDAWQGRRNDEHE